MSWSEIWTWKADTPARVLGEGGEVVAEQGAGAGEPVTGQLHAVTGIAGEADDELVDSGN